MKIVFVTWRDLAHRYAGGSEVAIDRLATGLLARGHEVALASGGPLASHPYEAVDLGGTYTQYLRAPFATRRFRGWDLLVDVENGVPFWSPVWHRGPAVCLVHHVHTDQWAMRFPWPVSAMGREVERRVMPRVYRNRRFLAVSNSTAEALEGIGIARERIDVVRWGMDPPPPRRCERSEEPQFVALGRLFPHKRIGLLLRAWERVRPVTGGRLVIAGDGLERERLAQLAGPDVVMTGAVSDAEKWQLLEQSWFLVHAASHEGWGIVIMEAAAVGTPVLGFDVPGVRESVVDGVTGVLAATEDEFVERWIHLARDVEQQRRLGRAAAERTAEFTWDRTVDEFLDVAAEVVGAWARAG